MFSKTRIVFVAVFATAVLASPSLSSLRAQDAEKSAKEDKKKEKKKKEKSAGDKKGRKKKGADLSPELQAYLEWGAPGEEHALLKKFTGKWDAVVKSWHTPGAPAVESKGSASTRSILGGRFVQDDFKGSMMGLPFQGVGITGYDKIKKVYTSSWRDTFSTLTMESTGTLDESGKVLTFNSRYFDPSRKKDVSMRMVITFLDENHHSNEFYDVASDGTATKMMEIRYTRRQPKPKTSKKPKESKQKKKPKDSEQKKKPKDSEQKKQPKQPKAAKSESKAG